jgi:Uma2 family endonuclease
MSTATLVSLEEYLKTPYEPDCDYVDGIVEERNLGEKDHSWLQKALTIYLGNREKQWNVLVFPELRIRVSPTRVRIPDLCIFPRDAHIDQVPANPPLVCIEILSPEDRWSRVEKRIEDFLTMGVAHVWVFDPQERQVFNCTKTGRRLVIEDLLEAAPVSICLSELFAELE